MLTLRIVKYSHEAKVWVSECPELNILSQGRTRVEAMQAIVSAVGMYLARHEANETVHKLLISLGIKEKIKEELEIGK